MARPDIEALLAESGWLRSLCRNLVRDRHQAEDIEQQTWLAVLRAGPSRRRAPRHWLRTVVTNFARQSLRRRDVRRASEHPVEEISSVPDPGTALERAEFRRTLVEAVLALDEPYRSTVVLRYFEEQSIVEIARSHGVPRSTVRTRLQRALDRLRVCLEGEYQEGWAIWAAFLGGHESTPVAVSTTLGSTFLSLLVRFRFVLGPALVAGLVYIGWQAMQTTSAPTTVAPLSPSRATEPSSSRAEIVAPTVAGGTRPASGRRPFAEERPSSPAPEASVRGRLLLESGAPATGLDVVLVAKGIWPAPGRSEHVARTAADGFFALRFDPPPSSMFTLEIAPDGYARERWEWAELPPGGTWDIGEFTLRRGGTIEGRVVDAHGAPLVAQEWSVRADPETFPPIPGYRASHTLVRADPRTAFFRFEDLPPGPVALTVSSLATGRFRVPSVEVVAGETVCADIVYEGPDPARRVVLAVTTSPFPSTVRLDPEHVVLHGTGAEPRHPVLFPDGSRWLAFDDLEDGVYSIEIDAPGCARWRRAGIVPGSLVRATIAGNAAVVLRVVDGDGAPLTKFSVHARNRNVTSTRGEFMVDDGTKPPADGRIPGFFPGDYALTVEADGHGSCTVNVDELRAHEDREVFVVVNAPRVLAGRVVFPDGDPATGVDVFLLTPAAVDDSPSSPVLPPTAAVYDRTPYRVQVDETPADDEGRFAFALARQGNVIVRAVRGVGIQVTSPVVKIDELGEEELVLTIFRGAMITGRLWDPAEGPGPGLRLVANPGGALDEHSRLDLQNRGTALLGAEGTFALGPLPPGEAELRLLLASPPQTDLYDGGRVVGGVALGTVELREGQDVARDFPLGANRPVPVTLRLLAPAGSVYRGQLTLTPVSDGYLHTLVQSVVEVANPFGPVLLFPGEWRVRVEGVAEEWTYEHPSPLTIRAGAPDEHVLSMGLARGTLFLSDAATGTPLANRSFLLECPERDGFPARPLRADSDGEAEVVLQSGTYRLGLLPLEDPSAVAAERMVEIDWTAAGPTRDEVRF